MRDEQVLRVFENRMLGGGGGGGKIRGMMQ